METKSIISLLFVLQAINNAVNLVVAQEPRPDPQYFKCGKNGNFTTDDLVEERDNALDMLNKEFARDPDYIGYELLITMKGFWTSGLCPPNAKKEACAECINNTVPYLIKNCPKQKEAVAWTALPILNCMVRYADYKIEGVLEMSDWAIFSSPPNQVANDGYLEKMMIKLANGPIGLKELAAKGDRKKKYTDGSIFYASDYPPTVYGSMQCVPDLSKDQCIKCLSDATNENFNCCASKRARTGIVMSASCYYWYSLDNFLDPRIASP